MRRLALATVLGSLVLAACSDQSQQTPTEPGRPEFKETALNLPCFNVTPWVTDQTLMAIFPGGRGKTLYSSAREKIDAIVQSCKSGKLKDAQAKAILFDDWMFKKFQGQLLIASPLTLITSLFGYVLVGVGLDGSAVSPDMVLVDGGSAVFDPDATNNTELVTTSGFAGVSVPPGSFDEVTLLVADKLPNNTKLKTPPGQVREQFPPFYDFNAINASNQHVLNTDKFAHIELCLYENLDPDYPPGIVIGHNPVFGAPGYPFEILPPDGFFLLDCGFEEGLSSVNPGGLRGLAVSAWRAAKRSMAAVFLPQTLRAATTAVGSGSASGKTSSLSPFGIVDATGLEFTFSGDPSGQTVFTNSTVTWQNCELKGCFLTVPAVRALDSQGSGFGGLEITATLVPVGSSVGTFTEGSTASVLTNSESGVAVFNDLSISDPGTYKLHFSITGSATSLTSGSFTVSEPPPGD